MSRNSDRELLAKAELAADEGRRILAKFAHVVDDAVVDDLTREIETLLEGHVKANGFVALANALHATIADADDFHATLTALCGLISRIHLANATVRH